LSLPRFLQLLKAEAAARKLQPMQQNTVGDCQRDTGLRPVPMSGTLCPAPLELFGRGFARGSGTESGGPRTVYYLQQFWREFPEHGLPLLYR